MGSQSDDPVARLMALFRNNESEVVYPTWRKLLSLNRALRTLSAGNRMLLRASTEAELLHGMCKAIVDEGGYRLSIVGYAQHDEQKTISRVAYCFPAQHDPAAEEALKTHPLTWADTKEGQTAPAIAIRTGKPVVGRNLLTDPDHAQLREDAIRFGFGSVSAFPLRVDGEVIGALGIAAKEPDAFDEQEEELLGELADDLAYGIAHLRMRVKQQQAEATIHRMAYYDGLTDLPNRLLLREQLRSAIATASENRQPLALLLISLRNLSEINDTLGYQQGDLLLKDFAGRLSQATTPSETMARVGDAEFALVSAQSDADHAIQTAQRIVSVLQQPIKLREGIEIDARTSIGIALFPGHGNDVDMLLRRARVAVLDATRSGRDYTLFAPKLERDSARRLALMGDLHHAMEQNELALYCQPKLRLSSSRICGAEALVRWQHPTYGAVAPAEFVKVAEHAGLITPLTKWVLEASLRQCYAWHSSGLDQPLSVNLSVHDLRDPKLLDRLEGLFATWGAEPDWIEFELTESALMDDPAAAIETLTRVKQLGVALFIDDFGTGYSSFAYLHKLPVDAVKIDQSFVMQLGHSDDSAAIVRAAVELGHNLGLEVVAEGVEDRAAYDRVKELGCDVAQGYYIGKPIPATQFNDWLADSPWGSGTSAA